LLGVVAPDDEDEVGLRSVLVDPALTVDPAAPVAPDAVGVDLTVVTDDLAGVVLAPDVLAVMVKRPDWARIAPVLVVLRRLTWNPAPVGHPELGGATETLLVVPSTKLSRVSLPAAKTVLSWLTRTAVKLEGSESTRCHDRVWDPEFVQPEVLEGEVTL